MPSRRRVLQMTAGAVAVMAGCASDAGDSPTASDADTTDEVTRTDMGLSTETGRTTKTEPVTDGESPTPDGLAEWTPDWTEPFGDWAVLGLTGAHSRLYTTLQVERTGTGRLSLSSILPTGRSCGGRSRRARLSAVPTLPTSPSPAAATA